MRVFAVSIFLLTVSSFFADSAQSPAIPAGLFFISSGF